MKPQLFLALSLFALMSTRATAQTPPDETTGARALVQALAAGDWAAASRGFSAEMRAALPPEQLAAAWSQITAQAGAFREIRAVRVDSLPEGRLAIVETAFERAPLDVRVTLLPNGEIGGLFFAPHATAPAAPPDYGAPADAPYTAEQVRIPTGHGYELAGTLTVPENPTGPVPAVVLITGSGPQDRDSAIPQVPGYRPFRQIADTLGRRGIAVLRVDDRGVGASGGHPARATTADFADDVRAEVAWLRGRPEIDGARIALAGHSEGGIIAPMVAVSDPRIRAVVLLAGPAWTGRRISDYQLAGAWRGMGKTPAQMDSMKATNDPQRESMAGKVPWIRFWLDYDPLPTARKLRAPTLILQGATDRQVSPEQAEELAAATRGGGNRDVTVRVFSDVNHLFLMDPQGTADVARYAALPDKQVPREVLGTLADWLTKRLR